MVGRGWAKFARKLIAIFVITVENPATCWEIKEAIGVTALNYLSLNCGDVLRVLWQQSAIVC